MSFGILNKTEMAMARVFVTGGSGFLGDHLIRTLGERGDEVVALARSSGSADAVRAAGASAHLGDLDDVAGLTAAMSDCDAVYHLAAVGMTTRRPGDARRVNVDGTRNVLDATRSAGVRTLVHASTEQVLFDGSAMIDVDETHPYPARHLGWYARTKAEAERLVLGADGAALRTVAVRPRLIWGPGDHFLPQLAELARAGRLVWVGGGTALTETCHAANAVHALILAAERGEGGNAYFVTDGEGPLSQREFGAGALTAVGLNADGRSLPTGLAYAAAAAAELAWQVLPGGPPISRALVALVTSDCTLNIAKARRQLGYEPVITRAEGLAELAEAVVRR